MDLLKLCIEKNWFTGGNIKQYSKMLNFASEGGSFREIALLIWLCTDDVCIEQIEDELEKLYQQRDK